MSWPAASNSKNIAAGRNIKVLFLKTVKLVTVT